MSNVLLSVSKKDKEWRKIAFNITKNKQLADDIVQEMYLRLVKYNIEKWNYSFIILLLWNEFKGYKKKNKYTDEQSENKNFVTIEQNYSFTDEDLRYLHRTNILTNEEKKLISLNYDLSAGRIAKNLDECRIKTYRKLIDIRKKVLKNDFDTKYKNRRLKYLNNG